MIYRYNNSNETRTVKILFQSKQSVVCEVVDSSHVKTGIELRYDSSYFNVNYTEVKNNG